MHFFFNSANGDKATGPVLRTVLPVVVVTYY